MSADRSPREHLSFPGNVIDFPTLAPEAWLARGHQPMSVRAASDLVGISESTLRRRLRAGTPPTGSATTVVEVRGIRVAAQRLANGGSGRWTLFILGPAIASANGGPVPVAELRSRIAANEAASHSPHRWWPFRR